MAQYCGKELPSCIVGGDTLSLSLSIFLLLSSFNLLFYLFLFLVLPFSL